MTAALVARADALTMPIADNTVDLIVTSPPYFALRSYRDAGQHYAGQIGSEASPAEFLEALWAVTAECWRVLKPTGSLFVNLGDKSATSGGHTVLSSTSIRKSRKTQQAWVGRAQTNNTGARNKSLVGIPWRYAIGCIDGAADPTGAGWILRAEIIWDKPNGLPESITDRVRRSHEQWFHLTKAERYYSALDEIREAHTGGSHSGRSDGAAPPGGKLERQVANGDRGGTVGGTDPGQFNPLGRIPGSVWTIPSEPLTTPDHLDIDHFAAFPTEWPRRLILGWSPPAVCDACGEGRRPVTTIDQEPYRDAPSTGRPHKQDLTGSAGGGFNKPGYAQTRSSATIDGYACACAPRRPGWTPQRGKDNNAHERGGNGLKINGADYYAHAAERAATRDDGYDLDNWIAPPSTPAVVLDPFGGTGTTAMVAAALGRNAISLDLSADYCRLAQWRITESDHDLKAIARTHGVIEAESVRSRRAAERAGQGTLC